MALEPGIVLAVEPMVTLGSGEVEELADGWTVVTADGRQAAHWEHTVAVTADGPVGAHGARRRRVPAGRAATAP